MEGGPPSGQKTAGSNDPLLNAAFKLALSNNKGKTGKACEDCPHHQKGECRYHGNCEKPHRCVICHSTDHGAKDCPQLRQSKEKKIFEPYMA